MKPHAVEMGKARAREERALWVVAIPTVVLVGIFVLSSFLGVLYCADTACTKTPLVEGFFQLLRFLLGGA